MTKSRHPDAGPESASGRQPSPDEEALWRRFTGDVRPLARKPRATPPNQTKSPTAKQKQPPAATGPKVAATPTRVAPAPAPMPMPTLAPAEPPLTDAAAPGLDKRTRMRLRRGQVEIQGVIDLHGHTQAEAHRALNAFIEGAQRAGRRAVLVVTGKGRGGEGVLRAAVPRWLNEPPLRTMIHAFARAQPKDGGEGALYILLRRRR